jgi:hypothetical protein
MMLRSNSASSRNRTTGLTRVVGCARSARLASRLDRKRQSGAFPNSARCALPTATECHGERHPPPVIDARIPSTPITCPRLGRAKLAGEFLHQQLPISGGRSLGFLFRRRG